MKSILTLLLLSISILCAAQDYNKLRVIHQSDVRKLSPLEKMEDTLVYYADSMMASPLPDARIEGTYAFIKKMRTFLQMENSFSFPLKKLNKKISVMDAPDKAFRIYTWEVIRSTSNIRYYGVVQMPDRSYQPLIDISDQIIRGGADSTFRNMRWYGAVYYDIIKKKIGDVDAYFLLGYNGNAINGDKKIMDVFGFDRKGKALFGAPLFVHFEGRKRKLGKRFIINYQKNSNVSMKYEKEKDMVVFDHCESSVGDIAKKSTYVPDGTYDGLKWDGSKWMMYKNVIQIMDLRKGNAPVEKPIK